MEEYRLSQGKDSCCTAKMAPDKIRKEVRRYYASMVKDKAASCCIPPKGMRKTIKGKIVKIAGYSDEELSQLPQGAIKNAIGCGNPVATADIREGDVVLDIGAGAGIDAILASKKVGLTGKVIGLDMTPEMIQEAIKNTQQTGVNNVEFRQGIMEDMPIENETIDWVISNCVINLSPNKVKVFKEIFRVLKPGGKFMISDIVTQSLLDSIKKNVFGWSCCVGGALDEKVYLETIRSAGFVHIKLVERVDFTNHMIKALFTPLEKALSFRAGLRKGGNLVGKGLKPLPNFLTGFTANSTELPKDALKAYEKHKDEIAGKITSIKVVGQKPIKS